MRFPPSFLEEIKARLPMSQVASKRVRLKKEGREFRGLSPFTSEKTPSFYVNDQKARFFDFSAGKNGNIFDFVMETEGVSFPEAVERLAADAGLALPKMTAEEEAREARRASTHEALELAARWFETQLQSPEGARARGYLADRGLGPALQKEFRLGYAPREKFGLRDFLAGKDVDGPTMIEAGLLVHGEDIAVPYDRFRDRVIFPIADRSGRVIAFGGRAMDKDVQAKYLNSPETPLFHKGHCLYNHHRARAAAHKSNRVIAVEGYVDVIAMHTAGFPDTVAPLGTALTPEQVQLLWGMAEEPILCFDGDRAGRKAAFRAIETALPLISPGRSLRFAFLPDGQDPDDLVRSAGPIAVEEVISEAKPLVDVLWQRELEAQPLDTPERRASFESRAFQALQAIGDENLRRHYREEFSARVSTLFGRDRARGEGRRWEPRPRGGAGGNGGQNAGWRQQAAPLTISPALARSSLFAGGPKAIAPREALILLLICNHPDLAVEHPEELAALELANPDLSRLRDFILSVASAGEAAADLRAEIEHAGLRPALDRLDAMAAISTLWSVRPSADVSDARHALNQALALHRRTKALHRELVAAEAALAEDANDRNLARLQDIQGQLSTLDGAEAVIEGFGTPSGRSSKEL
ncbi:MAG: DNA primase [Methylobacteriaceae bacterium]|nr:DNA primase [Methylobacteriaceae bacterium]